MRWQDPPFFVLLMAFFFAGVATERFFGDRGSDAVRPPGTKVLTMETAQTAESPLAHLPEIMERMQVARDRLADLERDIKENDIIRTVMTEGPRSLNPEEDQRLTMRQEELQRAHANASDSLRSLTKVHNRLITIKDTRAIQSIPRNVDTDATSLMVNSEGGLIYDDPIISPPEVNWGKEPGPAPQKSKKPVQ